MKKRLLFFLAIIITLLCVTVNAQALFENGENIYSQNVYMVNLDTGKTVYELNSEDLVYPASLTKVMTCIIAIEHTPDLDTMVTIPSGIFDDIYADGGANMALKVGEEISVGSLIKATMIRSACDSASALAWYVSGSIEDFSKLMNQKALEIGAEHTHFVNAHGLHDDNHYTTAKDMFLIANYALQNPIFCDIIKEHSCVIPATNKSDERVFSTTMDIENPESTSYYPYVTGVKSGFTNEAGRCLITKATKNDETYLLVTLGANKDGYYTSNMAFTDAISLFEYHFAQYSITPVLDNGTALTEIAVKNSDIKSIELTPSEDVYWLVALDQKPNLIFDIPENVKAPVKAGDVIGTVTVEVDGDSFTKQLIAMSGAEKKNGKKSLTEFNGGNTVATALDIFSSVLIVISVIIIFVFIRNIYKKRK